MLGEMLKRIKMLFDPPEFIIQVKGGKTEMISGKLPKKFLDEVLQVCQKNDIGYTKIYGINSDEGVRLQFAENIKENIRQRIRNLYGIYK